MLTKSLQLSACFLLLVLLLTPSLSSAQQLTWQQACDSARIHYPMVRQKQLVEQTAAINIDNLGKNYLPQISINGQASYQSEVTRITAPVPGLLVEPLSKDQYKLTADINQLIFDGGMVKQQKQLQQLNSQVDDQKLEVELYKLKERITQIFFSILYIDELLKQVDLLKIDLNNGIKRIQAQVDNGVSFKSNISIIKADLIKTNQRSIELLATRKGLVDVLSLFLQKTLSEKIQLVVPAPQKNMSAAIVRPEIKFYAFQSQLMDQQTQLIQAKNLPKASAFVQGGYGKPGFNFLKNEFDFFGIGGVRLNWYIGGLYTAKKEKQQVAINRQSVDIQKETFLLNTQTQIKQQQSEINKLQQLIESDNEIIALRSDVKNAATVQLDNGVITTNDYLKEVNSEDQARQARITHQLQLLQAYINLEIITGK